MAVIETVAEFPFVSEVTRQRAKPGSWDALKALKAAYETGGAWVPAGLAKNLLGVSQQRVQQLCESGTLEAKRIEGHLFITETSLVAFAKSERRNGRPPKAKGIVDAIKAAYAYGQEAKKGQG